jgi:F-type H+-transporting ATPase subunit a
MKWLRFIAVIAAFLAAAVRLPAAELDMDEYLYGHVSDSYEWHITTIKGHPVSVPLPVIVRSKTSGWHCFSSHHLEEGSYQGFRIAGKGEPDAPEALGWFPICSPPA